MTTVVDVATQFAKFPFGRYPEHGPNNGSRFREEFLIPALARGEEIIVDLSNARGLAASFLEEAFGGLVRRGFSAEDIDRLVTLKSDTDPSLIEEVKVYINEEAHRVGSPH